jgi:hypothetical protein
MVWPLPTVETEVNGGGGVGGGLKEYKMKGVLSWLGMFGYAYLPFLSLCLTGADFASLQGKANFKTFNKY